MGGILAFTLVAFCIQAISSIFFQPYLSLESSIKELLSSIWSWTFFVAVGVFYIFEINLKLVFFAPMITVTVKKMGNVEILRQRFYGNETQRFYFDQIEKFKSYKGKVKFSPGYFLSIILANRKEIKLNIPIGSDTQDTIKLVKKLNKLVKAKSFEKNIGIN